MKAREKMKTKMFNPNQRNIKPFIHRKPDPLTKFNLPWRALGGQKNSCFRNTEAKEACHQKAISTLEYVYEKDEREKRNALNEVFTSPHAQ